MWVDVGGWVGDVMEIWEQSFEVILFFFMKYS